MHQGDAFVLDAVEPAKMYWRLVGSRLNGRQ